MLRQDNPALDQYLGPIYYWLDDQDVTELNINTPQQVWIERLGEAGIECKDDDRLTLFHLQGLAELIAEYNEQPFNLANPILSGHLPNGCRVQIIGPPYCAEGTLGFSIRRQTLKDLNLNDYHAMEVATWEQCWKLEQGVVERKNIIVAGGTNTGKTTLLNALLKAVPRGERIITIEDARELKPPHDNQFNLTYPRTAESHHDAIQLMMASLRMNPSRIIAGELRGSEAYTFLRIIGSGHPGSMTSVHADNPMLCFEQLALMVMQSGIGLGREEILSYVKSMIHVVVQLRRFPDGSRKVVEIYENEHTQTI